MLIYTFADALMSGKAMEPVIEDWVERYEEEQDQALGELVVFLMRAGHLHIPLTSMTQLTTDLV